MVGSHKILTVSYGTFSCTLEGFEDSFETMKAIAEYFRDLAAEDRYFGAEPPQPDAEMLARIAEREIARRVEARMEASGIVLRVGQALDTPPAAAPAPAAPAPTAQVMPPVPGTDPQRAMPAPPSPESVAAKLQRIRSVVGKGAAPAAAEADDIADISPDIDLAAPPVTEATPPVAAAAATPAAIAEAPALTDEPAFEEEAYEAAPLEEMAAEDIVAEELAADEIVAEDLALDELPAVELATEEVPVGEFPVADLTAEALPVAEPAPEALPVAATEPEVTASAPEDLPAAAQPDAVANDDAPLAGTMVVATATEEPPVADTAPAAVASAPVAPEPAAAPLRARVVRIRKADFDKALAAGAIAADPARALAQGAEDDLSDLADAADLADLAALDAPAPTLSPDDEADLLAELAAVENGIEDDLDTAPGPSATTDDDLDSELAAIAAEAQDDAVPDDEADNDMLADIMRAVDEPEAQDAPDLAAFDPAHDMPAAVIARQDAVPEHTTDTALDEEYDDSDDDIAPAALPARARFAAPEEDEAALDRLMSQTDAQMSGPDAARRREAIAQLRAAVAATEAARALGETPKQAADDTEDNFREDLRQAVRPRRPVAPAQAAERPRPAPLKLVASQRVDLPAESAPAAAAGPIRPRRVTLDTLRDASPATREAAANADNFTDFAERMGATTLADLLEAAAAYTAFVEGSEDFSRPQILKKVNQLSPDTSREDGLRSFGTLLREGRFRRSPRAGRFEVAEDSRFNPDRHAV